MSVSVIEFLWVRSDACATCIPNTLRRGSYACTCNSNPEIGRSHSSVFASGQRALHWAEQYTVRSPPMRTGPTPSRVLRLTMGSWMSRPPRDTAPSRTPPVHPCDMCTTLSQSARRTPHTMRLASLDTTLIRKWPPSSHVRFLDHLHSAMRCEMCDAQNMFPGRGALRHDDHDRLAQAPLQIRRSHAPSLVSISSIRPADVSTSMCSLEK